MSVLAMGLLFFLLLFVVPQPIAASCECGYSAYVGNLAEPLVFTNLVESDFTQLHDISQDNDWVRQQFNVSAEAGRGPYGKTFLPENIATQPVDDEPDDGSQDAGLQLRVSSSSTGEEAISGAEIDTKRLDLHWGSYRAGLKLTGVSGTCAAFFWYYNDTQEIDMEFLSREFDREHDIYPMNVVVQSKLSKQDGYDASATGTFSRVNLTFDPTAAFHEYRFDYVLGHVFFYVDSQLVARMNGSEMPSSPGHLILQHWSNGNPLWSGGPPKQDAVLAVSYVKAYFNSSEAHGRSDREKRCNDASLDDEAVCAIPDVVAANASTGGSFFGDGGDTADSRTGPSDADDAGDGDESSGHLRGVSLVMALMTLFLWVERLVTA